jgi:hypothetical protein
MTADKGAMGADSKIRAPGRRRGIWFFAYGGISLVLAAGYLTNGQPWLAILWAGLGFGNVSMALQHRNFGIDLTPQYAIVRGFRRRNVPWQEVQEVVSHKNSNGTSVVGLILENGESVMLRVPMSLWRKGDAKYERDFHRIDQYWLAHRGASWHPVPPKAPLPPVQE